MMHLNIKSLGMIQIVFVIILILSTQVFAGNSWLNKGSDLLKSMGGVKKRLGCPLKKLAPDLRKPSG